MEFKLITCIVERGKASKVVDDAIIAGATSATMYFAKGKGVKEKLGIFGEFILPEKEVILIVTKSDQTDVVFDAIIKSARLDIPGKGFAFTQPVERTSGLFEPAKGGGVKFEDDVD